MANRELSQMIHRELMLPITVKPVLRCQTKIDKTKILKTNDGLMKVKTKILRTNGGLMKVENIEKCSLGAFCNTFHLH